MIYFSDFNITQAQGTYYTKIGRIERVFRGIWVSNSLTKAQKRALIQRHAVRIAKTLFPTDVLSSVSGFHHGAVDGVIYLARRTRRAPIRTPYLSIVFHGIDTPYGIPFNIASLRDSLGSLSFRVMSDEMLILQAFIKPRGASSQYDGVKMSLNDLSLLISRTAHRYGNIEAFLDGLHEVAKTHGMLNEFKSVRNLVSQMSTAIREQHYTREYNIYWFEKNIASLREDGNEWEFRQKDGTVPLFEAGNFVRSTRFPVFIEAILPEGNLERLSDHDISHLKLDRFDRYLSNITIRRNGDHRPIIIDSLEGKLDDHVGMDGVFTGKISGFAINLDNWEASLRTLRKAPDTPKIPGMQEKLAVNLSNHGVLSPASGRAFTHILKFPGSESFASLGVNEWYITTLSKMIGIRTEKAGLVDFPGIGPALIAERFDIRVGADDHSLITAEDFCSVLCLPGSCKYDEDLLRVAEKLMVLSTNPEVDSREFLKQVVFSWLVGNNDAHLKNFSILKRIYPDMSDYQSVELAPAYDLICTMVYQQIPITALSLDGKKDFNVDGFVLLGKTLGLNKSTTIKILNDLVENIGVNSKILMQNLPSLVLNHEVDIYRGKKYVKERVSMDHLQKINRIIEARRMILSSELLRLPKRGRPSNKEMRM